ncbi:hypothetical protein PALB_13030 [Pseudoalteromonas luteoviolacea B = ATCC 29581]|nr:hypothetical protein PALB_13030 [Pseudoalteromonas luteoviolacea B = ATCC 29581]
MAYKKLYRVKHFIIDPKTTTIRVDSKEFRLEPKVMEVLSLLIKHKGNVLSKSEILDNLWPKQILDVELVTRAIFEIRKIFCDDPKSPSFIKTIPKKGYIFIAEVEEIQSDTTTLKTKTIRSIWFILLSTFILFAVFWYAIETKNVTQATFPLSRKTETILYTTDIPLIDFAYSEANNTLYLLREKNGKSELLANNLTTGTIQPIYSENLTSITLSNDHLIAISCTNICDIMQYEEENWRVLASFTESIRDIEINQNQTIAALNFRHNGQQSIKLVSTNNWIEEKTFSQLGVLSTHPSFGPDGKLYYIFQEKNKRIRLGFTHYGSGESGSVLLPFTRITAFNVADDLTFKIAGKYHGNHGVWQFDSHSGNVTLLKALNPTDTVKTLHTSQELTLLLSQSSTIKVKSNLTRFNIDHNSYNLNAVFGHEDHDVFFTSNRTGSYELWRTTHLGTLKLTDLKADMIDKIVLSQTKNKVAISYRKMQKHFITHFDTKNPIAVSEIELPFGADLLSWSLDELHIYISQPQANGQAIFKINLANGEKISVADRAGYIANEYGDTLYYYSLSTQALIAKKADTEINVVDFNQLTHEPSPSCLIMIGETLYYCINDRKQQAIHSVDIASKIHALVFNMPHDAFITDLKVTPEFSVLYDTKQINQSTVIELK